MKNPIRRSVSGRLRPAMVEPTMMSVLTSMARQQDIERRQQGHEERNTFASTQFLKSSRDLLGKRFS